jgi:hypothetical protein
MVELGGALLGELGHLADARTADSLSSALHVRLQRTSSYDKAECILDRLASVGVLPALGLALAMCRSETLMQC